MSTHRTEADYKSWYHDAYKNMYEVISRYLHSLIIKYPKLNIAEEIDDCIQDTFLLLWRKRKTLIDHPNISGWLCISSRNKMSHIVRRLRKEIATDDIEIHRRNYDAQGLEMVWDSLEDKIAPEIFDFLRDYYDSDISNEELEAKYNASNMALKKRASRAVLKIRGKSMIILLGFFILMQIMGHRK